MAEEEGPLFCYKEESKRPVRIILVRHGESEGNIDQKVYTHLADSKVALTVKGREQAEQCGRRIRQVIEQGGSDWSVYFYVSPYKRTLQTLRGIAKAFEPSRVVGVREEARIREQDFGNFQNQEKMKEVKNAREKFGKFFYRFPEGESAADVYDRVTGFLETLWRDINNSRLKRGKDSHLCANIVIVTHGLTMRVFLMRWFKWTTAQFEMLWNPQNCEMRVMQRGEGGEYSLAMHHSEEEMAVWGLSPAMIREQVDRKTVRKPTDEVQWEWSQFFGDLEQECVRGSCMPRIDSLEERFPENRRDPDICDVEINNFGVSETECTEEYASDGTNINGSITMHG
eukprot:TRINITY_DN2487_c0_g5_i1.p1 TRINITY_DN2487_c0_g5~~TRINITY_DN2487_c0_g5_i1.p1  ORF type:complete len:341 (-),score=57.30 TRINITY_DN2487_c0_g5_i1:577-1599(-)